ncbi:chemotaxis protein CheD [Novimethylophilus kurashikiensis]|uniref:Probable chemoreceptor glutamine deamidase CheD n=1 Tax=Novimethylophilus kurashikiensis TaxID=1825523 RepID=A0A2R5F905_9PROT|nr:chemoreceptor glutamine deamidase CheD [Novimethylophilus kurashikiensis]GBG14677.1 chemotaxis protein CheD [Novimethylophilus kurashikiensis]
MSQRDYEETQAPEVYFDRNFNIQAAKILPGEYYVTRRDMLLVTTLGSCVSACIRDRVSGIGGMNHFMLPETGQDNGGWGAASTRYGTYAMEMLINQLMKLGARRENLEAKLFGGGAVIKNMSATKVGERNAEFGLDYLKTEGIPVIAKDLLDIFPRKVYFYPSSGRVLVKKLRNIHNQTIMEREREYGSRLVSSKVEGEIELFT